MTEGGRENGGVEVPRAQGGEGGAQCVGRDPEDVRGFKAISNQSRRLKIPGHKVIHYSRS